MVGNAAIKRICLFNHHLIHNQTNKSMNVYLHKQRILNFQFGRLNRSRYTD